MAVQVNVEFPDDNTINLSEKFIRESSGYVNITGRGNDIEIWDPLVPNQAKINLTGDATVRIGKDSNLNELSINALASGVSILIGGWASFAGSSQITAHESSTIKIGDYCLVGDGCSFESSDVHKIFDIDTDELMNPAGDIELGDNVWIAKDATILRGTKIGPGSIVGSRALVKGIFPSNVCIAGVPGRIIRTNVRWEF